MNRAELVEILASKHDLSKTAANAVLDTLITTIQTAVKKGDSVQLVGFGTFKARGACRQEPCHRREDQDPGHDAAEVRARRQVQGRGRSQGRQAPRQQVIPRRTGPQGPGPIAADGASIRQGALAHGRPSLATLSEAASCSGQVVDAQPMLLHERDDFPDHRLAPLQPLLALLLALARLAAPLLAVIGAGERGAQFAQQLAEALFSHRHVGNVGGGSSVIPVVMVPAAVELLVGEWH
jgi:hypothetical protein